MRVGSGLLSPHVAAAPIATRQINNKQTNSGVAATHVAASEDFIIRGAVNAAS